MKPTKEKFLEVLSQYQGILYKVSLVYFKNKAMENNELQKIWRTVDSDVNKRSSEELNLLLTSKAKQVFTEFLILNITAIPICVGVLVWLIISTANRLDDSLYVANNILLGIIVLFALFYVIREWQRFKRNKMDKPVKEWVEIEINRMSKWITGKYRNVNYYLIPVLYILTFCQFMYTIQI